MKLPLAGGCQCRAVRYTINAAPLTLYVCHCTDCQKQSASAFALSMVVARSAITIVAGSPREWVRKNEAGRLSSCMFCGDCGARLYHNPHANTQVTILKPGTLDDTAWLAPVGHIWTRSAQSWFEIPEDTVNYDAQPPDLARLIEAWHAQQG